MEKSRGAIQQSSDLAELNRGLEIKISALKVFCDAEVKANRRGCRCDLAGEFDVVFYLISDKFKKKEDEITAEIHF